MNPKHSCQYIKQPHSCYIATLRVRVNQPLASFIRKEIASCRRYLGARKLLSSSGKKQTDILYFTFANTPSLAQSIIY